MERRDEVGAGDVEEVSCGDGEEHCLDALHTIVQEKEECGTEECRESGEEVREERLRAAVAAVEEHGEVADLLRDFMEDHCDGCREADFCIDEVCRCDGHPVDHVVDAVSHEHQCTDGISMVAVEIVAVVPVDELLDDEGEDDPEEDEAEGGAEVGRRFARLREDVQKDVSEESSDSEADESEEDSAEERLVKGEEGDSCEGDEADSQNAQEDREGGGEHEKGIIAHFRYAGERVCGGGQAFGRVASTMKTSSPAPLHTYAAEFLGTLVLTLGIALSLTKGLGIPTPFVAALTVMLLVYTVGAISGAHLNPAVTVGLWSIGKITPRDAWWYIVVQCAGAAAALSLVRILAGALPGGVVSVTPLVGLGEFLGTFLLVFGVSAVVHGKAPKDTAGLVIGGSLLLGILIASTVSNAVLNPAVALGINSLSVYHIAAPILGGILAAQCYRWLVG